jgi:DNA polymerase-3 subunit epsilon
MNILYYDTETTGLPKASLPFTHPEQPHITQLGFIHEVNGHDAMTVDTLIKPDGWKIDKIASELTGITLEMCEADGIPIADAVELFIIAAENSDVIVCHNTAFDVKLMSMEYARLRPTAAPKLVLCNRPTLCTMKVSTPICRIGKKDGKVGYKWPKLSEATTFFFNEELQNAHSAIVDIVATRRIFHKLGTLGYLDKPLEDIGLNADEFTFHEEPEAAAA